MDLQEISDRMEIAALLADYCHAVDDKDWDAYEDVFTADAVIDYSEMIPFRGSPKEARAWLAAAGAKLARTQHIVTTSQIRFKNGRAYGRTICTNPMVLVTGELMAVGLWYRHEFTRTEQGWKISQLYEESCWRLNVPEGMLADSAEIRRLWTENGGHPAGPVGADVFPQPLR